MLFSNKNKWLKNYRTYKKQYVNKEGYNTILTDKVRLSMNCYQTRLNNNAVVLGGAGSGKNRFFILPNLLQANCSYIIHDVADISYSQTGDFFKEQGYKVKVLDLRDLNQSVHYNPLKYVKDEKDVILIASCLLGKDEDPFIEKCENLLLSACLLFLKEIEDKTVLSDVVKMLNQANFEEDNSVLDIMFEQLEKENPESMAVKNYKIFKMVGSKSAQSILISTLAKLQFLNYEPLQEILKDDTLDLDTLGDEKQILFIVTQIADDTFNPIVKMLYSQALEVLRTHAENDCERYKLPVHVKFILDEFAQIGYIPNLVEPYWLRQANMSYTICLQSLIQLKAIYPKDWEYLIDNADTLLFLGSMNMVTLEYMAKKLDGLMSIGELQHMPCEECILFIRGVKPIKDKKYNPIYHKNYKKIKD